MSDKNTLFEVVKNWVQIDNQINQLNKKMKELKTEKKNMNLEMMEIMKQHDIDIFDLKDGQIQYKKETKRAPLNQKRLLSILSNHPQLEETQAIALNEYIFNNRPEIIKESIVRKVYTIPTNES
jgi:hypothetical protein